jgi:integrase
MPLASTGMRAQEALSLRIKDFDLKENSMPAKVFVRGEYTRTRTDRTAFLTDEMTQQLKLWIDYKYRQGEYLTTISRIRHQKIKQ